jgi:ribonuclease VapC
VIVIDSSAVIAIIYAEPLAETLIGKIRMTEPDRRFMSAASYIETGTVLAGHSGRNPTNGIALMDAFVDTYRVTLAPVDEEQARIALEARIKFGRGFGAAAGLNFGDSFAYALAKTLKAPLLFVGDDFSKTDCLVA